MTCQPTLESFLQGLVFIALVGIVMISVNYIRLRRKR